MWEISVGDQTAGFLLSVLLGALFCGIYDIVRAIRKTTRYSFLSVFFSDIILWLFYALLTFIFLISQTNGEIRGYIIAGEFLGFIVYRFTFSKFLFKILCFIFTKIAILKRKISKYSGVFYTKSEQLIVKIYKYTIKIAKRVKKLLKNWHNLLYTNKNISNMENALNETKTEA